MAITEVSHVVFKLLLELRTSIGLEEMNVAIEASSHALRQKQGAVVRSQFGSNQDICFPGVDIHAGEGKQFPEEVLDFLSTAVRFPVTEHPDPALEDRIDLPSPPWSFLGVGVVIEKGKEPILSNPVDPQPDGVPVHRQSCCDVLFHHACFVQLPGKRDFGEIVHVHSVYGHAGYLRRIMRVLDNRFTFSYNVKQIMQLQSSLSSKYQTVIPASIRRRLKLDAGDKILWRVVEIHGQPKALAESKPARWSQYSRGLDASLWKDVNITRYIDNLRQEWQQQK